MRTMTLTEFNQNPSRATRLADEGDVLILRRGTVAYRLSRVQEDQADPLDALLQAGVVTPPRVAARPDARRTAETAADLGAVLDADRDRLGS